jgi:iron complex outermembrane receptor protein
VSVIQLAGKAPGLKPETAETWTLGLDWRPARWAGLEAGVHYFSVRYRNRIQFGSTAQIAAALASGAASPLVLERSLSAADVLALYADPTFFPTSAKPPPSQIFAVVDFRQNNLGSVEQSGFDLTARYHWTSRVGELGAEADAVHVERYAVALLPGQPLVSLRNTNANPIAWHGVATLTWDRGPWDGALRANYVGGYRNTMTVPAQPVSAWTTFDLHLAYAPETGPLGRAGVRAALDVQNILDRGPPRMANVQGALGYDPEEASALGRLVSLTLAKRW